MKNKAIVRSTSTHSRSLETEALLELLTTDKELSEKHKEYSGISYCRFRYLKKNDMSSDFFLSNPTKSFTTNKQTFIYTLCRNINTSSKANAWVKINLRQCKEMYTLTIAELLHAVHYLAESGFLTVRNATTSDIIYVQFDYSKLVKCKLKTTGFLSQVLVDRKSKETSIAAILRDNALYDFIENRLLVLVKNEMIPS